VKKQKTPSLRERKPAGGGGKAFLKSAFRDFRKNKLSVSSRVFRASRVSRAKITGFSSSREAVFPIIPPFHYSNIPTIP
jgi:hypothetical protein